MTADEVKEIIKEYPLPEETKNRTEVEAKLFTDSILTVGTQLGKTVSTLQVVKSWLRWKRERNLEKGLETEVDTTKLWRQK